MDLSANKKAGRRPVFLCFFNVIIYGIISNMKNKFLYIISVVSCFAAGAASANWQYAGTYVGDGAYIDDGARFVMSVRGGAAIGNAKIKNEMGPVSTVYYVDDTGYVISEGMYKSCGDGGCDGFRELGAGDLSTLSSNKKFSEYSFAAGASVGWTLPNRPQWRVELGWDHISEADYNASPMFDGDLVLNGSNADYIIDASAGAVQSKLSSDVISVMAFYDFFDGVYKPVNKLIPYVGFGAGYADTKTILNLTDLYGNLSWDLAMQQYGKFNEYGTALDFYKSEEHTSNVAGILAAGASYGVTSSMFLDFGARVMYIPRVKWKLTNSDDTSNRDFFNAESLIYVNLMLGLRFEF